MFLIGGKIRRDESDTYEQKYLTVPPNADIQKQPKYNYVTFPTKVSVVFLHESLVKLIGLISSEDYSVSL